jgi:NADH-quinone oxidoreductase subunit N
VATVAYGVALLYAATGETAFGAFGRATHNPLYLSGLALVAGGLLFQLLVAPTERWSVLVNVAAIGALLRVTAATRTGDMSLSWQVTLAVLAALAICIGTVAALTEQRLRRLVGYATLLQLGSVAMAAATFALPAAAFALCVSAASAIALFATIAALRADDPRLRDLAGLARRRPALVIGIAVALAAVVGLPATAGFIGRIYVFEAAVRGQLLWLIVLAALAAAASFVAFARVVLACFPAPPIDAIALPRARVQTVVALLAALAIVAAGLLPGPLLQAASAVRF